MSEELDYRYSLANERTYLAWVRTGLALIAGDGGRGGRLEQAPGVVDVGQRDVAGLEHEGRGAGGGTAVGLVHDHPAERTSHH